MPLDAQAAVKTWCHMLVLVESSFLQPSGTSVASAARLLGHLIDPVLQSLLTSSVSSTTSKATSGSESTMFAQVSVLAVQYAAEVVLYSFSHVEFQKGVSVSLIYSGLDQSLAWCLVISIATTLAPNACACHKLVIAVFTMLADYLIRQL